MGNGASSPSAAQRDGAVSSVATDDHKNNVSSSGTNSAQPVVTPEKKQPKSSEAADVPSVGAAEDVDDKDLEPTPPASDGSQQSQPGSSEALYTYF